MKRFKWFVLVVCWVCNTKSCQYCSPSCVESKTFEKKFKCLDSLYDIPKIFWDLSGLFLCISKRMQWILKNPPWKKNCAFLQSPHQVDMKKVVKCQRDFFAYSNALETRGVTFMYFETFVRWKPYLSTQSNLCTTHLTCFVLETFCSETKQVRSLVLCFVSGRGVSEKVLAVGFCLGSGLFGSCNSN